MKTEISTRLSDNGVRLLGFSPIEADQILKYMMILDNRGEKNRFSRDATIQKASLCNKGEKEKMKFDELIRIANDKGLDFVLNACRSNGEETKKKEIVPLVHKTSSYEFEIL